jgi:putative PIN family toxin of toxin-antitoxin system
MIKLVLDTNLVVSAVINDKGLEARVLDLAANRRVALYVSVPILAEYESVLSRRRFRLTKGQVREIMRLIRANSSLVRPTHTVTISPDEPDNRFLECAEAAEAQYLVTGNKRHFPKRWKNTVMVNAREFLETIALHLQR